MALLVRSAGLLVLILSTVCFCSSEKDTRYDSFHVVSEINARFSTTRVRSVLSNLGNESKELTFAFQLPETALISSFTMEVGGRRYYGVSKEKAAAREEYDERTLNNENVGLVESRGKEVFQISLNTGPRQQATFELQYQQLLLRYQSKYRLELNLNPGDVAEDVSVTIQAVESQGIDQSTVSVSEDAAVSDITATTATVTFTPTIEEQLVDGGNGLARDLTFEYDVNHPTDQGVGLVLSNNGYFAHFFSPGELPVLRVNIVFVIDVSGSMSGEKIEQARDSLIAIIGQLDPADSIGIVKFESSVQAWNSELVTVSENRQSAVTYAQGLHARGGTNLEGGVQLGISLLKASSGSSNRGKILVLLTDGQPTAGVTNSDEIVENVITAVGVSGVSVNCLGFGQNLDFNLLERLALSNNGIVRRIYEGTDAGEQLQGFFEEITSPLLSKVNFNYPDDFVEYSTVRFFPFLFAGGELVVVGKFTEGTEGLVPVNITAYGASSEVTFRGSVTTTESGGIPLERLVAYYRILSLLDSRNIEGTNSTAVEQEALALSIEYNFVTELTSLIVVEEGGNSTNSTVVEDDTNEALPDTNGLNFNTYPASQVPPGNSPLGINPHALPTAYSPTVGGSPAPPQTAALPTTAFDAGGLNSGSSSSRTTASLSVFSILMMAMVASLILCTLLY